MISQVAVYAENTRGAMLKVSKYISDAGIDITNVVTNDSAEFGIIRMIVSDPEKAVELLGSLGYMCRVDKVIGVEISDDVGSLTSLLDVVNTCKMIIDYIFVSYSRDTKTPLAIMKVTEAEEVEKKLRDQGYKTL